MMSNIRVVGFDDIEIASYVFPQLTTISQPKLEMGRRAVLRLLERMTDKTQSPRRDVLAPTLVVRESSVAPARRPFGLEPFRAKSVETTQKGGA